MELAVGESADRIVYVKAGDECKTRWCNRCTFKNILGCKDYSYILPRSVYDELAPCYQSELEGISCLTIVDDSDGGGESGDSGCENGEHKYDYCADGTRVTTDVCIPPDWVKTNSDCEKCTSSGSRTRICADGIEIVTHRCVDGKWIPTGEHCPGSGGGGGSPHEGNEDIGIIITIVAIIIGLYLYLRG